MGPRMALRCSSFAVGAATVIAIVVVSRAAFRQKPNTVVIREPGHRLLGPPQPAQPLAAEELPYAFLSAAAYGAIPKDKPDTETPCIDANLALEDGGWILWPDFPAGTLQSKMNKAHLRVQVWSNEKLGVVVVAFGGTVFSSWKDWRSNLRWFDPFQNDEYTLTAGDFSRAFRDEFARKANTPGQEYLRKALVHSTGHSLGGGLAEQFAYAVPPAADGMPQVTKVYAFDPSPVTGFLSVKRVIRDENKQGLKIDRIYERGEVLAIVRSITSAVHKPSARNPEVRQLRYNLFGNDRFGLTNVIAGHSIQQLACGLNEVASGQTP